MSKNLEIVKRMNELCQAKNFEEAAKLLHPQYKMKDPMMTFNSPAEFIEGMKNCPFDGKMENVVMMEAGPDKVVQTLECVSTKPVAARFRACDVLTIKDGKIFSEEMFYDTAQLPKEALELARQMAPKSKAA